MPGASRRLYTDRERAALAWTEAVTLISETHAPDDVYEAMRAQFSEAEAVNLTMLIGDHQCLESHGDRFPRGSPGEGQGRGGVSHALPQHPNRHARA